MGEIVPGVAVFAVVLADRPPLALAEVGSPFLPGDVRLARVVQPFLLRDIHHMVHFSPPLLRQMSSLQSVSNTSEKLYVHEIGIEMPHPATLQKVGATAQVEAVQAAL